METPHHFGDTVSSSLHAGSAHQYLDTICVLQILQVLLDRLKFRVGLHQELPHRTSDRNLRSIDLLGDYHVVELAIDLAKQLAQVAVESDSLRFSRIDNGLVDLVGKDVEG